MYEAESLPLRGLHLIDIFPAFFPVIFLPFLNPLCVSFLRAAIASPTFLGFHASVAILQSLGGIL